MEKRLTLAVIGAGVGGYTAAFYAADLGMDVILIDSNETAGGVCLNRGCIPSKALLHIADIIASVEDARVCGVDLGEPKIDIARVREWKEGITKKLYTGLAMLSEKRGIRYIRGVALFVDAKNITVRVFGGGEEEIAFDYAVVATGSLPARIPGLPASPVVMDSTAALRLDSLPESLLVVGGGYIGLELGSAYAGMGSRVSLIEMTAGLLPGADRDLVRVVAARASKKFEFMQFEAKLLGAEAVAGGVKVKIEDRAGKVEEKEFEKMLVCVGRRAVGAASSGLKNTRVELDGRGFIKTDGSLRTAEPNIFAVGDTNGRQLLAHTASAQAHVAIDAIFGKDAVYRPAAIPAVVFTDPELAWCGITEAQAKEDGTKIKVARFPWGASGRAMTVGRTDGATKIIADPESGRILGVGIVGRGAGDMIAEAVVAMEMGATVSDLARSIHPHPTFSETLKESAEAWLGHCTHVYAPKR